MYPPCINSNDHGKATSAASPTEELCAALSEVCDYMTPWTMESAPGEEDAYERAQALIERYTSAT